MKTSLSSKPKVNPEAGRGISPATTKRAFQIFCSWPSRTALIAVIWAMTLFVHASVPAKAQTSPAQSTSPIPEWECPVSDYGYTSLAPGLLYGYYRDGGWHRGIDIFGRRNTDLVATENGEVDGFWDRSGGWSAYLRADSGNVYYYTHLNEDPTEDPDNNWPTQEGGWIPVGARVGGMGDSGNAKGTGVHLHFEFRQGGLRNNVDPLPYISKYCIG